LQTVGQLVQATDHHEAHPILDERLRLAANGLLQQRHQRTDLFLVARPVLRREAIEREVLDAALARRAERPADRVHARAMPGDRRKMPPPRPAPIAVHDDRQMPGYGSRQTARISFSFALPISSVPRMLRLLSF